MHFVTAGAFDILNLDRKALTVLRCLALEQLTEHIIMQLR